MLYMKAIIPFGQRQSGENLRSHYIKNVDKYNKTEVEFAKNSDYIIDMGKKKRNQVKEKKGNWHKLVANTEGNFTCQFNFVREWGVDGSSMENIECGEEKNYNQVNCTVTVSQESHRISVFSVAFLDRYA